MLRGWTASANPAARQCVSADFEAGDRLSIWYLTNLPAGVDISQIGAAANIQEGTD